MIVRLVRLGRFARLLRRPTLSVRRATLVAAHMPSRCRRGPRARGRATRHEDPRRAVPPRGLDLIRHIPERLRLRALAGEVPRSGLGDGRMRDRWGCVGRAPKRSGRGTSLRADVARGGGPASGRWARRAPSSRNVQPGWRTVDRVRPQRLIFGRIRRLRAGPGASPGRAPGRTGSVLERAEKAVSDPRHIPSATSDRAAPAAGGAKPGGPSPERRRRRRSTIGALRTDTVVRQDERAGSLRECAD